MLSSKKSSIEFYLHPIVDRLSKVDPNALTLIGSIPPLLFFVFLLWHYEIVALIIFIGNGFDLIDGMVARKYHKVSAFGGFLDSTLDRVSDFLIITAFAFSGIVRWEIVAPFLLFAYLTSYIRSRGELANPKVSFAMGLIERSERLVLIFIGLLLYILLPNANFAGFNVAEITFVFITLLSLYTVIQRTMHAYKKL
ncbi:MAG TPA: CDP-alcohol phosphatidyltransferase family protein [Candidatus Saccharimonadales bacterium]|nr:CDP-alcohol phosphatidyltransferase family protein [Candidatus Saccharimonadales bacterium]